MRLHLAAGTVLAYNHGMNKPKRTFLASLGAVCFASVTALAPSAQAQKPADADQAAIANLVAEIAQQQAKIVENQKLIETHHATIAESLRIARIYVSRGGGPAKK